MVILKGKSFILRPFRKGDEASLQRNINNKRIYKYTLTVPYPYTKKNANDWIKNCLNDFKNKKRDKVRFAIIKNNEVIGSVGFHDFKIKNQKHKAELGYWLTEQYWGKGIMTEAVKLVTKYGFEKLKLKRIYACCFEPNKASAKVLEKAGFQYEGKMRKAVIKDGKYYDELIYAKLKRN